MFIYLAGERERANPKHTMYVAPAADKRVGPNNIPSDWINDDNTPKTFPIDFNYGRASVDEQLGRYLVSTGQAQPSSIIRSTGLGLLGDLAKRVIVGPAKTQF